MQAARIGSAPFLFPAARTVPLSGRPPSITKDCISDSATSVRLTVGRIVLDEQDGRGGEGRYRSAAVDVTREQAWQTLTRYTQSESLLRHALAVEASVRWYARSFGEDE